MGSTSLLPWRGASRARLPPLPRSGIRRQAGRTSCLTSIAFSEARTRTPLSWRSSRNARSRHSGRSLRLSVISSGVVAMNSRSRESSRGFPADVVQFNSIQFNSIQFNSIQCSSLRISTTDVVDWDVQHSLGTAKPRQPHSVRADAVPSGADQVEFLRTAAPFWEELSIHSPLDIDEMSGPAHVIGRDRRGARAGGGRAPSRRPCR